MSTLEQYLLGREILSREMVRDSRRMTEENEDQYDYDLQEEGFDFSCFTPQEILVIADDILRRLAKAEIIDPSAMGKTSILFEGLLRQDPNAATIFIEACAENFPFVELADEVPLDIHLRQSEINFLMSRILSSDESVIMNVVMPAFQDRLRSILLPGSGDETADILFDRPSN